MNKRRMPRWLRNTLTTLLVVGIGGGFFAWYSFFRAEPDPYADAEPLEHFLYASMGTEGTEGIPYWIWVVLPTAFEEYLPAPGGYASLGFSWEEGREMPMGLSKLHIGFDRVGQNCSICHVTQVRLTPDQPKPDFYPTGPSHQFRAVEYLDFLMAAARDERFNADVLMPAIDAVTDLSWRERFVYRYLLIPLTRDGLLDRYEITAWQRERPPAGPGRMDPFNPMKFQTFGIAEDNSTGIVDIPSIWNQAARAGGALHWDGLSHDLNEVAISSAIGSGAVDQYLNTDYLQKVTEFLTASRAPAYPLEIDNALAATGGVLFDAECSVCHAPGAARIGSVIPTAEVGTDPERTWAWTEDEVAAWKELAARYQREYDAEWNLDTFAKYDGYVAAPLDGIWLRAPYLHNGSVPSLRSLLEPPENRPAVFYRGYELYDGDNVGFVSDLPAARGREFFLYDTSVRGNSNSGHLWGTELSDEEKAALLEFLKTL